MLTEAGYKQRSDSKDLVLVDEANGVEFYYLRPRDIAVYVGERTLDLGFTGRDMLLDSGAQATEIMQLGFAGSRFRFAAVGGSRMTVADLQGKRIATEAVGLTKRYLAENGVEADIEFSWGATEVKAPELVDAIVELTETGSSLRANQLRIVDTVLTSTTRLIANKDAWADKQKRAKIEQMAMLLAGALNAENKVLLKMNAKKGDVAAICSVLPALHAPTVNPLGDPSWVAIETVVDESIVREIIPQLKAAGASGIIELALNKVVP